MTVDRPDRLRYLVAAAGAATMSLTVIGCGGSHPQQPVLAAPAGSARLLATMQGVIWSFRQVNGSAGLLRSTSRGRRWAVALPAPGAGSRLVASFFFGGGTAWAVERTAATGAVVVLRTANGGRSWGRNALPGAAAAGPAASYQIYFADALHGWVLASGARQGPPSASPLPHGRQQMMLWSTVNTGRTWTALPGRSLPMQGMPLAGVGQGSCSDQPDITFANPVDGWLTQGSCGHGTAKPRVWRTRDGGRTWAPAPLPAPAGGWGTWAGALKITKKRTVVTTAGVDVGQVRLVRTGVDAILLVPVSVGRSGLVIERSSDGGRNWQVAGRVHLGRQAGGRAPDWWFDPVDVARWVISAPGRLIETADGGRSWTYVGSASKLPAAPISFLDLRHGFLLGAGAVAAFHTADHGQTWTAQPAPQ